MTTGRQNRLKLASGFTLLELILVMLLISVALAVASPQLVALLRHARDCARVEGVAYDFHFDDQKHQYWLTRRVCGADEPPAGSLGRRFALQ